MEYIHRHIEPLIKDYLKDNLPRGAIVSGIIGVGKTTLVEKVLNDLAAHFKVFKYSGDDIRFRRAIVRDSRYVIKDVRSVTNDRALIFVDEIQKTPAILDALKLAHDEESMSFIVTGSEPQYLLNEARNRLQRRAKAYRLHPFSLNEIYAHKQLCDRIPLSAWDKILQGAPPDDLLNTKGDWEAIRQDYAALRTTGTIPLVYRERTRKQKFDALSNILERGYRPIAGLTQEEFDIVQTELATLNNREFTYQTIFNKTRLNRREKINAVISTLIFNGLVARKRRRIFDTARASYHVIYSFVDAGLASYLQRGWASAQPDNGHDLESLVFSQLRNLDNSTPVPVHIDYYTPYYITPSGQIKYKDGEVDFILDTGHSLIPIEVKATGNLNRIRIDIMRELIDQRNLPYGIVFYQGAPWKDSISGIYYLPLALL